MKNDRWDTFLFFLPYFLYAASYVIMAYAIYTAEFPISHSIEDLSKQVLEMSRLQWYIFISVWVLWVSRKSN